MIRLLYCALALLVLGGCLGHGDFYDASVSPEALRLMQKRYFDTADTSRILRAVIACLQDDGVVIEKADEDAGTVSGLKRSGYSLRMKVTVRALHETQSSVRVDATYNARAVGQKKFYDSFFEELGRSLHLQVHLAKVK